MNSRQKSEFNVRARLLAGLGLGSAVMLEFGAGVSALAQAPTFYPTADGSHDLAWGDFDRDGSADLAVSSPNGEISILFSDGTGGFSRTIELNVGGGAYIVVGDIDGDLDIDLVTANGVVLNALFNDGAGNFGEPFVFAAQKSVAGLAMGDVTGNGAPDLLMSQSGNSTWWFETMLNDGNGTFTSDSTDSYSSSDFRSSAFSAVEGDFDLDGDVDAIMMHQDNGTNGNHDGMRIQIMLNDGDGTQWTRHTQLFNQGDFYQSGAYLAAGDFDNDGDRDLMFNNGERDGRADLRLLANDGTASFDLSLTWTPSFNICSQSGHFVDIRGQGLVDALAVAGGNGTRVYYLRNETYSSMILNDPEHDGATRMETPDLNGDGMRDLVILVSSPESGVLVLLNSLTPHRPSLAQSPLIPGQMTTFDVTDMTPGDHFWLLYSLAGVDTTVGVQALGGISIDLASPVVVIASAFADQAGQAQVVRRIPANAPIGALLATQAVVRRGSGGADSVKSNFITAPIGP